MAIFSFDISSDYDKAELNNVFDQASREIANRYDFKGTPAALSWTNNDKTGLTIIGSGEWQIETIIEIVRKKLAARGQSQKLLDTTNPLQESNLKATKDVPFKRGLNKEQARRITKTIAGAYPKVKASIQGESVRVSSNSKDELQAVITLIKNTDLDLPLQFTNFR